MEVTLSGKGRLHAADDEQPRGPCSDLVWTWVDPVDMRGVNEFRTGWFSGGRMFEICSPLPSRGGGDFLRAGLHEERSWADKDEAVEMG